MIFLLLALVLVLLGCSPTPPPSTGTGGACVIGACPAGSFSVCEPGDGTTPCCQGGRAILVCTRRAGILSHACPTSCPSQECAIGDGGAATCCLWSDGGAGACD